ncbi:NAD-dependent protein deacetylase of SIR2 family [Lachnospiraceae bacterium TWA4]|nr:NAD-dependent protein deacetylase of SIR2 family [Lachnospiraceae bacterium TWA4]
MGEYVITSPERWSMKVDLSCIQNCPHCGKPMTENLRIDDKFVQDEGWHAAKARYEEFLEKNKDKHVLYMELGGMNTPVWIKYPFWRMTNSNPKASYACLNYGEAYAPAEIRNRSICMDGDIAQVLKDIIAEK